MTRELSAIAKALINIEIPETLNSEIRAIFHEFCRAHNIKKGTRVKGNGIEMDNFEWTLCKTLFLARLQDAIDWAWISIDSVPDDLMCYEDDEGSSISTV